VTLEGPAQTPLPTPPIQPPVTLDPGEGEEDDQGIIATSTPFQPVGVVFTPTPGGINVIDLSRPGVQQIPSTFTIYSVTSGGVVTQETIGRTVRLYAGRPGDPDSYLYTDGVGNVFLVIDGTPVGLPPGFPVPAFAISAREENNYFVSALSWSADGSRAAAIIDGNRFHPDGTFSDGVWLFSPGGGAVQILPDCEFPEQPSCQAGPVPDFNYQTTGVTWSPSGNALMVSARITSGDLTGRNAQIVIFPPEVGGRRVPLIYDYGAWGADGRIIASGRNAAGEVVLARVAITPEGNQEEVVLNASAAGLWVQNAVERSDGQIVTLGRPGSPNGAMCVYNQQGVPLTGPIGDGPPISVLWSPDGRVVVLTMPDGRQFSARADGPPTPGACG
jgi:hypothetical protein